MSGENPFTGILFIPLFNIPVFILPWEQVISQNAGVKSPYQFSAFPGGNNTFYHQLIRRRRGHMAWQHSVQRRWKSKWGQIWVNFTHTVAVVVELCHSAVAKQEMTPSVQFMQTIFYQLQWKFSICEDKSMWAKLQNDENQELHPSTLPTVLAPASSSSAVTSLKSVIVRFWPNLQ